MFSLKICSNSLSQCHRYFTIILKKRRHAFKSFVLAVLMRCPINDSLLCDCLNPVAAFEVKRETTDIPDYVCMRLEHLTPPPCVSGYPHATFLCLRCTPPSLNPLGSKALTCKGRRGISCPPAKTTLALWTLLQEPPRLMTVPAYFFYLPNFLYLIPLPGVRSPCSCMGES